MTEGVKTIVYVGAALVLGIAGYAVQPRKASVTNVQRDIMFDEFTDPSSAYRVEIVKSNELGIQSFEVARDAETGAFTLPKNYDYPADAEDRMKTVATLLIDLKIQGVASDVADDHELYGVVDPSGKDVDRATKGLGTLLKIHGKDGDLLADIIIGKPSSADEGATAGKGYRFVRRTSEDRTYVVKIDPEQLSTRFEDWIEQDLLKVNAIDIENLSLRDYGIVQTQLGATLQARAEIDVNWDSKAGKWELTQLRGFDEKAKPVVIRPSALEELDQSKLDEMKRALDDLKIAGVHPKPESLTADLKLSAKVRNQEGADELQSRGFYAGQGGEILGANGEVHIVTKEGIEYVLHFGGIAGLEVGKKKKGETVSKTKLNRYLMVRCQFNESKFPMPVKEQLKPPAGSKKADQPPAPKGAKKKDDGKKKKKTDIELEAEKARIEKEYKKKLEERKENMEKAKKQVAQLNARFAKWYYIVSEDVYKKVHLNRETVLKESANAKEEGFGIDAFRLLEKGGIKGSASSDAANNSTPGPPPGLGGPGGPGGPGFPGPGR